MNDKELIKLAASAFGKLGGNARTKKLSKERRIEIATKASHARHKGKKK